MSTATLLNVTVSSADAPVRGERVTGMREFGVPRPAAACHPDLRATSFDRRSTTSPSVVDAQAEWSILCRREPERVPVPVLLTADHAFDLEHWAEHLVNPALLVHAFALQVGREPLLLVPVGETRRGGILFLRSPVLAVRIVDLIHNRPGFHDCRLLLSTTPEEAHSVVWGEGLPAGSSNTEAVWWYGLRSGANTQALFTPAQRQLLRNFT